VITVPALVRAYTALGEGDLAHVERLTLSWQPLADLSFADLLLFAPVRDRAGRSIVLSQVRPVTGQTLYPRDTIGAQVDERERPLMGEAFRTGEIVEGEGTLLGGDDRARLLCIPVRRAGNVIGVVTRYTAQVGRRLGELERNYLDAFGRFAGMVAEGSFPFPAEELNLEEEPGVGDGVVITDTDPSIRYASPNAVSAMHRMGMHAYSQGVHLRELGFDDGAVRTAMTAGLPVLEEVEQGDSSTMMRIVPFLEHGDATGALILMRDVTDLRRRDRMLMTKDATIREIHHRVKNNLQTIAALLRLQGRRLRTPEAQQAIWESERRIRSIALVHETLSHEAGEVVPFDEIVRPLVRVVGESVASPDIPISFRVEGTAGDLPGAVATPLAVVLNELIQNALDHAFGADDRPPSDGSVCVRLDRAPGALAIVVADDGSGLPVGFELATSKGLGLSIVQALVEGELGGTLKLESDGGTRVHLAVPVEEPRLMEVRPPA